MDVKKDYIDIDTALFSGISTDLDAIRRSRVTRLLGIRKKRVLY